MSLEDAQAMPVAIVGMGCRFPGDASSPDKLWDMLLRKESARSETPLTRVNVDAFHHPNTSRNGGFNNRGGHYLKTDISAFDASFFSISPAEAISMDPMQRMLLEVVYESIENAGFTFSQLAGSKTGCFVGCFTQDYADAAKRDTETLPKYNTVGTGQSILSNRISFCFDLKGPSVTLDTACSSSLVALHLACQSLKCGESKTAIVGATNTIMNPDLMIGLSNLGFLSPDSISYAFDSRANGYARGEGIASIVLKPLADALRDGDTIRAIIRGTAVNSNGKSPGITLPTREAQIRLIRSAYDQAGCDPATTAYVEAHGTGTQAGDPIEAGAIDSVIGTAKKFDGDKIFVGSIKTNIGHLEGASGLAGLIKAVLSVEAGVIAPNLWFEKGNPKIDWKRTKVCIPTEPTPWPIDGVRRASVNSFGYGGTNGHVIVDDAYHYLHNNGLVGNHRTQTPSKPEKGSLVFARREGNDTQTLRIFPISGRDPDSVTETAKRLADYVRRKCHGFDNAGEAGFLHDLSFTLCQHRSIHEHRSILVAASMEELLQQLDGKLRPNKSTTHCSKIAFVFTGQGAQWWAMGRELIDTPVFRRSLDACRQAVRNLGSEWDLIDELVKDEVSSRINEAIISQPLCTALQVCLVDHLASLGIYPAKVVGHSSGEIAAAYAAGILTLETAVKVAYFRGHEAPKIKEKGYRGGMLAVGLSESEALKEIDAVNGSNLGKAVVACVNSPRSVTLSGDAAVLAELQSKLNGKGIFARSLLVDTAYHSHHMMAIAQDYKDCLGELETRRPTSVDMVSSVTGQHVASSDDLGADYWVENMVSCVRFSEALTLLCSDQAPDSDGAEQKLELVELGPHAALSGPVKQILAALPSSVTASIKYSSSLRRGEDSNRSIVKMAAALFETGYPIRLHPTTERRPVLTDLPPYSWNHSRKYWSESRLSRDYRMRRFPRTEILGAPASDWNPIEPRWRGFVRLSEQPWVAGHVINGSILYPAAGFCSMAFQAMSQVATSMATGSEHPAVAEYRIREFSISKALVVPRDADGVEVALHMRPNPTGSFSSSETWNEFRVFSYTSSSDAWAEHCRGQVAAWTDVKSAILDTTCQGRISEAKDSRWLSVDTEEMYNGLDSVGLSYGAAFRSITELLTGPRNEVVGTIQVTDTCSEMPEQYETENRIIHPTTMDSLLQLAISALCQGDTKRLGQAFVPTFIQEIAISGNLDSSTGRRFLAVADASKHGFRDVLANVAALEESSGRPAIRMDGIKCRAMGSVQTSSTSASNNSSYGHCGRVFWRPDVDSLSQMQLNNYLKTPVAGETSTTRMRDLEFVSFYFMCKAVESLRSSDLASLSSHHRRFLSYMEQQRKLVKSGKHEQQTAEWKTLNEPRTAARLQTIIQQFSTSQDYEGQMVVRMGQALPMVLRGETDPLALMMEGNLLYDYYTAGLGVKHTYPQVAEYINLLSHKSPGLEYLEIGAGTGGCTVPVLEALNRCGIHEYRRLKSYTYTDISSGFFDKASTGLARNWTDVMHFKKLDIEQDPESQGFGQFDVIIAANVLHATKDIARTMAHVRSLLRPGGKLVLLDMTHKMLNVALIFGCLPGWWLSTETWREHSPLLDVGQWQVALTNSGFSDLQASSADSENPLNETTRVIVASAIETPTLAINGVNGRKKLSESLVILVPGGFAYSEARDLHTLVRLLCEKLEDGKEPRVCSLNEVDDQQLKGVPILSLVEWEDSMIRDISEHDFRRLQLLSHSAGDVLWVTRGAWSSRPDLSIVHGLARSLRSENEGRAFITLDLSLEPTLDINKAADLLLGVYERNVMSKQKPNDTEFLERNGILHIKRLIEDDPRNQFIAERAWGAKPEPKLQNLWEERRNRPLKLEVRTIGDPDSLAFSDIEGSIGIHPTESVDDQVDFEVMAVGLNFRDVLISLGELVDNYFGNECAGIVKRVGSNVKHLAVGDRVVSWCLGSFATEARCPAGCVQRIPESMSWAEAASLPVVHATAYYCLVHLARLAEGESVLVHSGAGGVGQAAIQLAQLLGAEVYVTVGSNEKRKHLAETYELDENRMFNSRDLSFVKEIRRATGGRGVDVVLNSLAGDALHASWTEVLGEFGRFVEIGRRDIDANSRLGMGPCAESKTFTVMNGAPLWRKRPKLSAQIFAKVMEHVHNKELRHITPIIVEPFSRTREAFRLMQSGRHMGKIVLELRENDSARIIPRSIQPMRFTEDASFLLAGGLGGLGRSISRWMADNGARHLIFVSRRGSSSAEARQLIEDLEITGVQCHILKCDVTDTKKLSAALGALLPRLPPLRGVIQGAMVLKDAVFASMSHDSFVSALMPKVHGSWALHTATVEHKAPLDFFVMLSSVAAFFGNAGQSNYAAGCTYQSALARYRRRHLKLPGVAIDIGKITGVGYVAENAGTVVETNLARLGIPDISEAELLAILEASIDACRNVEDVGDFEGGDEEHIVTGVTGLTRRVSSEDELPFWGRDPAFSHTSYMLPSARRLEDGQNDMDANAEGDKAATVSLREVVAAKDSMDEVALLGEVLAALTQRMAKALMLVAEEVDVAKSPANLGADSLVGVEIRNFLAREAKIDVPVFDILGAPSLTAIAKTVTRAVRGAKVAG